MIAKRQLSTGNLVQVLRKRAGEHPERRVYRFLTDGETVGSEKTYAGLDREARAIGALLQREGARGERVLLLYPPGLEFVTAFFGCLYAGAVAVPAYPPRVGRAGRLRSILADARPGFVLTTSTLFRKAGPLTEEAPELENVRWFATDDLAMDELAASWRDPDLADDELAFLQYTSGSTAAPKGVMVAHANLVHNETMIRDAFEQSAESIVVGWLPLYHDMGLIGNVLQPLFVGAECVLMPPLSFLQSPMRWLRAVSRYAATTSGGPNFAYDLCVRKADPGTLDELDLSRWRVAYTGAEPVRAETLDRFANLFAPYGFRRQAFFPCYGLAEATLFVSGGSCAAQPFVQTVDAAALEQNRLQPAEATASGTSVRRLVGCGHAWAGQEIVIADPETGTALPREQVGEIWVAGASVARGYWDRPEETARDFAARLSGQPEAGPFLRTGDLGFVHDGELFVTGRVKDLIIVRGRNHYPQDLELTAEQSHPSLRPGCSGAFAVDSEDEEQLILVHEIDRDRTSQGEEITLAVRRAISEEHQVRVHEVVLLRPGTLPKTSSGKVQRHACRAAYLQGSLPTAARAD